MDITAYLQRIHYQGSLEPTVETLRNLQIAQLLAVPFENLSIHANQPIVLNDEALFKKIVGQRRGGFCYELNGLFAALLRGLGFDVAMLAAGVARAEGGFGYDYGHMTLMVTLEQRWLVDVGFGDSFREPLLVDEPGVQKQGRRAYRIEAGDPYHLLLQSEEEGDEKPQYRFTLQPCEYDDYLEMCHYHQTSPESHFTRAPICTLATPEGRLTLSGMRFIKTSEKEERQERALESQQEFAVLLKQHFGIVMTP